MKGKKKFWKKLDYSKIILGIASLVTMFLTIILVWTAFQIREVLVKTQPDIRIRFYATLMESGIGYSEPGKDSCSLWYFNEENIESFTIDADIINIGSGVAYDLDVTLSLPGLKYSEMKEGQGVKMYVGERQIAELGAWTDNFSYGNIILSPQGGIETIRLTIPFKAIGSIENLPTKCTLTIVDITGKTLLENTVIFYFYQHGWRAVT